MEGEVEDSEDDVAGEDKTTVLWEKCIQQRIFVDLSEDESLHLSDLESSLALCLSQESPAASEASIHLSGSAELSALEVTSSESSMASSQSERMVESTSGLLHASPHRPNAAPGEDPGQNTSDEDQDDLPYDGNLGIPFFNQTPDSEGNTSSGGRETIHESPDAPGVLERSTRDPDVDVESFASAERDPQKPVTVSPEDTNTKQGNMFDASKPRDVAPSCSVPADINQLLLRHFSQEELLQSGGLIEAETLPDVSLLESVDDTAISWAPTPKVKSEDSGRFTQEFFRHSGLDEEAEQEADDVTPAATDSVTSSAEGTGDTSAVDVAKQKKTEDADQGHRAQLLRTRSFSEMKYGQGQVHYPLPDFSKVAPKVKIPKAPSGPARPAPRDPSAMHRAQSSPGMLEVISRVLEDSVQPSERPYIFSGEVRTPPALVHHLQAQRGSDLMVYLERDEDHQGSCPAVRTSHLGSSGPHLPTPENSGEKRETAPHCDVTAMTTDSSSKPEAGSTDGERMTAELGGIITQFMQKVEEFRLSVSSMSLNAAEQQMMLRSIMEAQDQMERNYISRKEEHRALEMQNYMGLCRNTGTFDPDRLVEGDIFRIGMYIEDIKEMIDKNMCEQIYTPHSSSTPTPKKEMLDAKPGPLCLSTPCPPPSRHEGPSAGLSTVGYKKETWRDQEMLEVSDDENGLQENYELVASDASLKSTAHGYLSRTTQGSVEALKVHTAEAEEERGSASSGARDHSDILDFLSGPRSSSTRRQRTPDSDSSPQGVLDPVGECDLGVGVSSSSDAPGDRDSLSLPGPPPNTSAASQRIVSPETDSGFGSSYLNQSASEPFQPNPLIESLQSQSGASSSSDSEGSNLQTAVHTTRLADQRWASTHPSAQTRSCGAAAAVQRWVESTGEEPSFRRQDQTESEHTTPAFLCHHTSEQVPHTTMDAEVRYSSTCNSEAILALQSEVSRLKNDLEEGLVQLPRLAQKMDYLTSKYRPDRQERRAKARTRTQLRSACDSVWKLSNSRQHVSNLSSSQVRTEDWISSDLEPSKSKGLQKPLLQVGYASSSSLPASYKVGELLLQPSSPHRKCSAQSDTALLPSNVFFQRTASPASGPSRTSIRTKEQDMSRTLDRAIEVACSLKRTTDRMAKRLSADLLKARLHRKGHSMQPLGGRKHHAS